ncbi:MAG TPA: hypothetical protein VHU92_18865 [Streptosporangiaceae bacterium]|nr:hypothetical protein [Streptosporangiaceae bacterium]
MFRTALTDFAHRGVPGLTGFFTGHGRSLAFAGTALAVAGAGISTSAAAMAATASPAASASATPTTADASHVSLSDDLGGQFWVAPDHDPAAAHPTVVKARVRVHVVKHTPTTWQQIQSMVARQTFPRASAGALPSADRVQPVSVSGAQAYLPMTASRMANAATIVRQDLARHMGLRSAVIAVATAMQESTLENISYGDRDSEGLFQQRPSAGWGSPAQITNPAYAANAFLNALHGHQQADPRWASQPLWENAQAVQNSGFPYAYAKWESQAAQVVSSIARHMF